jgi:alpha 1,2-mannosyltransferase
MTLSGAPPSHSSFYESDSHLSHKYPSRISFLVSGAVHFGQIPAEHWYQPSWINETKAEEERNKMQEENVIYGGSLSCANFRLFLYRVG